MPAKTPRFVPTLGLIALWLAVYFLWLAVRPEPVATTRPTGSTTTTTTNTVPPVLKLKP
jgi:hypothetical protein